MKSITKILVPTDFSPAAQEALRIAADLSRRYEAPLTLAHVYERAPYPLPDGFVLFSPEQLERLLSAFRDRLAVAREEAEKAGAFAVSTLLLEGHASSEITSYAADAGVDLIVMGTRGRRGLPHLLLGSVAERVVQLAACPVLTVRQAKVE